MRNILILLFAFVVISINAQEPYITGSNSGDGELKARLRYADQRVDSSKATFNYEIGFADLDSIETDQLTYTNTYWDDLKAPFSTAKRGQTNKPDFDFTNVGLLFPQNDTTEIAYMIMQYFHKRKNGTDIEPHIHWQQSNSNDVVWKIVYKWFDNGATVPATWTPLTEANDVFIYTSGDMLQITDFTTIDGSGITGVSSIFLVKVYRNDNVDGGAGSGDVLGFEFDVHYEIDAVGSRDEYVK